MNGAARERLLAGYAALAVAVQLVEAGLPSPVPGIKPGLANAVTLIVLQRHGWRAAATVSLLRVLVSALLLGSLLSPGFWLATAGALGALLALGLGRALPGALRLSPIGLSLLAAVAHVLAQYALARLWLLPHPALLRLLPLLLLAGAATGLATGTLAAAVLARMTALQASPEAPRQH